MNTQLIRQNVFEVLADIAPEAQPQEIGDDDKLRARLDLDSFDFLTFLIGLSKRFGVDIPESDYGRLQTIRQIVAYLSNQAGSRADEQRAG